MQASTKIGSAVLLTACAVRACVDVPCAAGVQQYAGRDSLLPAYAGEGGRDRCTPHDPAHTVRLPVRGAPVRSAAGRGQPEARCCAHARHLVPHGGALRQYNSCLAPRGLSGAARVRKLQVAALLHLSFSLFICRCMGALLPVPHLLDC